jgi:hypothetical protein
MLRRISLSVVASMAITSVGAGQAGSVAIAPARVTDERLADLLLHAEPVEIVGAPEGRGPVYGKLWRRSEEGNCVAGTHWVCSYDYFFVYSDYGEAEEVQLYHLGQVGEIVEARWEPGGMPARLTLTVRNYPEHALKQQTTLTRVTRRVALEVGLTSIRVLATP